MFLIFSLLLYFPARRLATLADKVPIDAFFLHQVLVGTLLHDLSVINDKDHTQDILPAVISRLPQHPGDGGLCFPVLIHE